MRFDYDGWQQWRDDRLSEYPRKPDRWRYDLELSHPRDRIEEMPCLHTPHWPPYACYYKCDDWSTIFGVYNAHHPSGEESLRMLVESCNPHPVWGERICLLSTSSYIQDEEWGRNIANKFAIFRGRFWRVSWHQFMHNGYSELYAAMGNRIIYPIRMEPYPFGRRVYPPLTPEEVRLNPIIRRWDFGDNPNLIWTPTLPPLRYYWGEPTERINWKGEGF